MGIAPNKFLAKVASDWRKPNGQFSISAAQVDEFVASLPVRCIPGVGPKSVEKLKNLGIHTCQDIRDVSSSGLRQRFGKFGELLIRRANGQDDRPIEVRRERKSISIEHTFANDLSDLEEIQIALVDMWPKFLKRVEQAQLKVAQLAPFVKVKFADFQVTTLSNHDKKACFDDYLYLLHQASLRDQQSIRLIGIGAKLVPQLSAIRQLSLPLEA